MEESTLETIVATQQRLEGADSPRSLIEWLGQSGLDLATKRRIAPQLTVGGDFYLGQVVGEIPSQRLYSRFEFIFDLRSGTPVLFACRDLSGLGRGF